VEELAELEFRKNEMHLLYHPGTKKTISGRLR